MGDRLKVLGSGFRVQGQGFRVQTTGFRGSGVVGWRFRGQSSGSRSLVSAGHAEKSCALT